MERAPGGMVTAITGYGLDGDINAHVYSPRQVLLTRMEDNEAFDIPPGELRENFVLEGLPQEDFNPGNELVIGSSRIRLTFHCEPCKRIGHLLNNYKDIENRRGILGVVTEGGIIRLGDSVSSIHAKFPPLSTVPCERFERFMLAVPAGRVVTYYDCTVGMGVAESFIRAIPGYISRADPQTIPVHRIVDVSGQLIASVANQEALLKREGICPEVTDDLFSRCSGRIDLEMYRWQGASLHLVE